jgi:hypothetical protein
MFKALREAYSEIQNTREEVQKRYDEFAMEKCGPSSRSTDALICKFHPARLPKREALPDLAKCSTAMLTPTPRAKSLPPHSGSSPR